MRILIVDDDDDVREVLSVILRSEGHQIDEAIDGLDALRQLLAGISPQIILLDMMMPRMDGEAFIRTLRRQSGMAQIPFVIISGHQLARQKATELGAAGCLVKPIEYDQLKMTIGAASHPVPRS